MNPSAVNQNKIDERIDDMRELVAIIIEEYNKLHNANFEADIVFSFEYNEVLQCAEAKPRKTNARVMPVVLFVKNAMERIGHYVEGVEND